VTLTRGATDNSPSRWATDCVRAFLRVPLDPQLQILMHRVDYISEDILSRFHESVDWSRLSEQDEDEEEKGGEASDV
jgi:hypothetical protein